MVSTCCSILLECIAGQPRAARSLAARTLYGGFRGFGRAFTRAIRWCLIRALLLLEVGEISRPTCCYLTAIITFFTVGLDAEPTVRGMDVIGQAGRLAIDYHSARVFIWLTGATQLAAAG